MKRSRVVAFICILLVILNQMPSTLVPVFASIDETEQNVIEELEEETPKEENSEEEESEGEEFQEETEGEEFQEETEGEESQEETEGEESQEETEGEESQEETEGTNTTITLSADVLDLFMIEDKEYDGTTDVTVDDSKVVWGEIAEEDDVDLTYKAAFDDKNAGEGKTVIITDFELIGEDADKYKLDIEDGYVIYLEANITPREIHFIPQGSYVVGELQSSKRANSYKQIGSFVEADNIELHPIFSIVQNGENVEFVVDPESFRLDDDNYLLIMDDAEPSNLGAAKAEVKQVNLAKEENVNWLQFDDHIATTGKVYINICVSLNHDSSAKIILKDHEREIAAKTIENLSFNQDALEYTGWVSFEVSKSETIDTQTISLSYIISTNLYKDEAAKFLDITINDSMEPVSKLIFDNAGPEIVKISTKNEYNSKYIGGGHYLVEFDTVDAGSGIESVIVKWDQNIEDDKELRVTSYRDAKAPGIHYECRDDKAWASTGAKNPKNYGVADGMHQYTIIVQDKLGNITTKTSFTDGEDWEAPIVTKLSLDKIGPKLWEDTVRFDAEGIYVNQPLYLTLSVKDMPNSSLAKGVKSVRIVDGKSSVDKQIEEMKSDGNLYTYTFEPNCEIDNLYIQLIDEVDNYSYVSLRELLQNENITVKFWKEETKETQPELLFDWSEALKGCTTDRWVINHDAPETKPDYGKASCFDESFYCNENDFQINIEDMNGILYYSYKLEYNPAMDGPVESDWEWSFVEENAHSGTNSMLERTMSFHTSDVKSGCYRVTFECCDVCQNETCGTYYYFVDHEKPNCSISVVSPVGEDYQILDGDFWVCENDIAGNKNTISVRIDIDTKGADISDVLVKFVGTSCTSREYSFKHNDLLCSENGYYVLATIPSDLMYHKRNQCFNVQAIVTSNSKNSGSTETKIHIDTESPSVNVLSVAKLSRAVGKVMNILPFGVFANDAIRIRAKVSDPGLDSGIDHVEISYVDAQGIEVMGTMTKDEKTGLYVYDVFSQKDVLDTVLVITAYDRMGRKSVNASRIQDYYDNAITTEENTHVVLDGNAPSITVVLPNADYVQDDDSIWYRAHNDSEEDSEQFIELIVSDSDSGIRQIDMWINGKLIDHKVDKNDEAPIEHLERDGIALLDLYSSTEIGRTDYKELCKEYHYFYSIETIAKSIESQKKVILVESEESDEGHGEKKLKEVVVDTGRYTIEIVVTDNAGNVSNYVIDENGQPYLDREIVFYRDVTAPEIEKIKLITDENETDVIEVAKEDFVTEMEYGYYFPRNIKLTVDIDDNNATSQLDYIVFTLIPYVGEEPQEPVVYDPIEIEDGIAPFEIPNGFKGQLKCIAYDRVGNPSEEIMLKGIVIDNGTPMISMEAMEQKPNGKDGNGTDLFTGAVQYRVTVSDIVSGVQAINYSYISESGNKENGQFAIPENAGADDKDDLGNGWMITGRDHNLVTEISKVFVFTTDDNDICFTCQGIDRALNASEAVKSEKFTIDTLAPQVFVENNGTLINQMYYNGATTFSIKIVERNFSPESFNIMIHNNYNGVIPVVKYTTDPNNKSIHYATIYFPEGDYSFSISGTDICGHRAKISYNGAEAEEFFSSIFRVDATKPQVITNFKNFGKDGDEGIFFNKEQTAEIIVNEHNFFNADMGIKVYRLTAGSEHRLDDENWSEIGYQADWKSDGDTHTLQISFGKDGIYRITMNPVDRAGNQGIFVQNSADHTAVFEIDTTVPILSIRSNTHVGAEEIGVPYYEVYDERRKDENPPFIEFDDTNIEHIEVEAIIYTPIYENGKEMGEIVISPISEELTGNITGNRFDVSHFDSDGVYAFTLVAVDKAGNKSEPFNTTYFRMVDIDVLAYIYNSKKGNKYSEIKSEWPKGYYSLVNEDGKPISKKATDFEDLDICIIKPIDDSQAGKIVLREDERLYSPHEYNAFTVENEVISDTAVLQRIHLPGEYFAETFPDDGLNTRMYLSASIRDDVYLDLASIHIDNEAPVGTLPLEFTDWKNFYFKDEQVITITGISETLDDDKSKVYDCPRNGERVEIPHTYDASTGTYSFTLTKGVHHIDISLVDEAGNEWNVPRVKYVRVGNFRLYTAMSFVLLSSGAVAFVLIRRRKLARLRSK